MTYDTKTYRKFAREQGLGELTDIEMYYIEAQDAYNYYAAGPSMSYGMVQDAGDTYRAFKEVATPERMTQIIRFLKWLAGDE